MYKIETANGSIGSDQSDFNSELLLLLYDLTTLSISKFHKLTCASIIFNSPFICSCVKVVWILVFDLMRELQGPDSFWRILSTIASDIKHNKNPYERLPSKKLLLRRSSNVACKTPDLFSIWLICGLVKTLDADTTSSNGSYEIFESQIKSYLAVDQSEENLRVLLVVISEVIANSWAPRSDVLMLLWEGFHRKINSPFLIPGQNPSTMAVSSVSGAGYLSNIKAQQSSTSKLNPNTTSFDMFVILLGRLVKTFTDEGQKVQVQKIFGRIYTKFPSSKLQALNEMGIHNLLKLFLTLCLSTNFQDVAKKVSETLLQIPFEKINHQQVIMKGHVAMLILHRDNQISVSYYVTKLMVLIDQLTERSSSSVTAVLKIVADALPAIILHNSNEELFENGEDLLLDSWIVKFLTAGTSAEQDRVFESLTKIFERLREAHSKALESPNLVDIVKKLCNFLLPYCKQTFAKSDTTWMPTMVANLCLLVAGYDHLKSKDIPTFEVLFKNFIDHNGCSVENSVKFLTVVLENRDKLKQLDHLSVMQHWIKCSVMLSGSNEFLKQLTRCMLKFDEFTSLCETARSQPEEFLNSKEPLCTFITDVGKKFSSANQPTKSQLIDKMHNYFLTFEKWALPILQLQQQQVSRNAAAVNTDEVVMRIYTFISFTILHCSQLIYVRSKAQCFFNTAMTRFILPTSMLMGHPQPRSIIVSIYRVWPLLIDGIYKLDHRNDTHVGKVLQDVIVKWAPLLKITTNSKVVAKPFINVTKNEAVIELVFGKLAKAYVALQNRKPSPHACMILTMFEEVLHEVEGDEKKLLLVWKSSMVHVIEAAMMTEDNEPSQITCYNLLERFTKNRHFESSPAIKELFVTSIQTVTQGNLSYHSNFCFR